MTEMEDLEAERQVIADDDSAQRYDIGMDSCGSVVTSQHFIPVRYGKIKRWLAAGKFFQRAAQPCQVLLLPATRFAYGAFVQINQGDVIAFVYQHVAGIEIVMVNAGVVKAGDDGTDVAPDSCTQRRVRQPVGQRAGVFDLYRNQVARVRASMSNNARGNRLGHG